MSPPICEVTLLTIYREHIIIVLVDSFLSAEITEKSTSAPLPTKVTATVDEGYAVLLARAKALIDLYLSPLEPRLEPYL